MEALAAVPLPRRLMPFSGATVTAYNYLLRHGAAPIRSAQSTTQNHRVSDDGGFSNQPKYAWLAVAETENFSPLHGL